MDPNTELPSRIPLEIILSVLLGLIIVANITIAIKCKV